MPSLDAQTITHWFDGSIVGILALGAFLGFWRGVIRQILWVGALGASLFALWWTHRQLGLAGWRESMPLYAVSSVAACATYGLARKVTSFFRVLTTRGEMTGRPGMLAGIIPSGGLIWILGVGLRWMGAQGHLEQAADTANYSGHQSLNVSSLWSQAKHALDSSVLGQFVGWSDPVTRDANVKLARLLILASHARVTTQAVNPTAFHQAMQVPAIQSLVRNERLRMLIAHQDFYDLLNDPALTRALADPQVYDVVNAL